MEHQKIGLSANCMGDLISKENIENVQVYVGEFNELIEAHNCGTIYYKEHPLNHQYQGVEEPRDWMFNVEGYYPSFFTFWKKCKTELLSNDATCQINR